MGLAWNAVSRGLAPSPLNPGPMSQDTMAALRKHGLSVDEHLRLPIKVTAEDFESNHHIIAVKEAEHRMMIQRDFPTRLDKVEFWHIHDLDCCGPEEAISCLDQEVAGLLQRISSSNNTR